MKSNNSSNFEHNELTGSLQLLIISGFHWLYVEYLQKVRIEASKKKLEVGRQYVDEIMVDVGYFDSQTFRELFKKITGLTPLEYRQKYNKISEEIRG